MKYLHEVKKNKRAGFTMIEVLITVAVLAVLSAVVLPSMHGFITGAGRINRMSVARTVYLAAQNQLTKNRLDKSLKSVLTGRYYLKDGDGLFTDELDSDGIGIKNVALELEANGIIYPSEDVSNRDIVHYISKPKGYHPDAPSLLPPEEKKELDAFYYLLDEIILDKDILNNAILMEYNIRTGVVLSVFYGDAGQTEFLYLDASDDDINNITGERGNSYSVETASRRHQGYYGAESSGEPVITSSSSAYNDTADIYDGISTGRALSTASSGEKINVLYAEFLLAKQYNADGTEAPMPVYTFEIVNANSFSDGIVSISVDLGDPDLPSDFDEAVSTGSAFYRDDYNAVDEHYYRYIWIIDYIEGDMINDSQPCTISRYAALTVPAEIRAKVINPTGGSNVSLTSANTLFARELTLEHELPLRSFEVKSVRHLNNIRYAPSYNYRQTTSIDFLRPNNEITNFQPIDGEFSGKYNAVKDTFSQYKISNLNINSAPGNAGLFLKISGTGSVQCLELENLHITAADTAGALAAENSGLIDKVVINNSGVSGNITGGISGINLSGAEIKNCLILDCGIIGNGYTGGVTGSNSGSVSSVGSEDSFVSGSGETGGIAGNNTGTVSDVYFLSTMRSDGVPVSGNGGGIVGSNYGTVSFALYLAPAPGYSPTFYPIVRNGNNCINSYFISGYRYSTDNGLSWPNENINYNRADGGTTILGGGRGLLTKFVDKAWIAYAYSVNLDNWMQTPDYPYPVLRTLPVPASWPEVDSPARPEQLERESWDTPRSISERAENLGFVNGDFSAEANVASQITENPGSQNRRIYIDMTYISGWYTRPVSAAGFSAGNLTGSNGVSVAKWRLMELQEPINVSGRENLNDYAYTDYKGNYNNPTRILNSDKRYAELNAEVQGTLYQVCSTTEGEQFYYSFYHTTRLNMSNADDMSFYLTPISNEATAIVQSEAERAARDSVLTLIRPCRSPRVTNNGPITTNPASNAEIWNKDARITVAYGSGYNLSYHRGRSYKQPDGSEKVQNIPTAGSIYLYDLWIGNTSGSNRNGYGITFWSTHNLTVNTSGNNNRIPTNGMSESDYNTNTWTWLSDARNNVIGYWGVEYGWKHYYGLYTVPEGQVRTEFAFQSNTPDPNNGNFLDGISFKTPSFVSINKFVKQGGKNVKFVKQGDRLTVELNIVNKGEMPAGSIVVEDRLSPYTEYIDYEGNVVVKKDGEVISDYSVTEPNAGNNYTFKLTFPSSTVLETDETITVTFDIYVRTELVSLPLSTLLFYVRNQGVVYYVEDANNEFKLNKYQDIRSNASAQVVINIDPVELSKTIEKINPDGTAEDDPAKLIDGPFRVRLTVKNMAEIPIETQRGLVTDIIPVDFKATEFSMGWVMSDGTVVDGMPVSFTRSVNADGSARIMIKDADLTSDIVEIFYSYKLEYIGNGYGVSLNTAPDYRYLFSDGISDLEVMMDFPRPVVGISVKTNPNEFTLSGSAVLNITADDSFTKKLYEDEYDVMPEVILTDEHGNPRGKNSDNYYFEETDDYTAILAGGTNNIEFTPKNVFNNTYEIYYRIKLSATKLGGTPPEFILDSEVTKVTITYVGTDLPVYYEKYEDNSYGFYAGDGVYIPADALDNTKKIIESGYGVLSAEINKRVQAGSNPITESFININGTGVYFYKLDVGSADNFNLIDVKSGTGGSLTIRGKILPNFAKAVYPSAASNAGNTFFIRTENQMQNIGLVDAAGKTFVQERNLDFTGIDLNADGAVVKGLFKGTFDGNGLFTANVTVNSPIMNNVGLFSRNSGTIKNIKLVSVSGIIGNQNVGGITGYNQTGGAVQNCAVTGTAEDKIRIEGSLNVGSAAGLNEGTVTGCTETHVEIIP